MSPSPSFDTEHRLPFPIALLGASLFSAVVAFVTPPTPFRRILFFSFICSAHIYIIAFTTTGNAVSDYLCGCGLAACIARALDLILLTDYQKDLTKLGQRVPASELGFWERSMWAIDLSTTVRGVGWNWQMSEVRSLPPKDPILTASRPKFALYSLLEASKYYILIDALQFVWLYDPLHLRIDDGSSYPYLSFPAFKARCMNLSAGLIAYSLIQYLFNLTAALSVAVGASLPSEWPPVFTRGFGEAYTLRRFWSISWHQLLRRCFLGPANALIAKLGISPSSTLAAHIRISLAFILCGLIHGGGDYMANQSLDVTLPFFLLQPFGIIFEENVIWIGRKLKFPFSVGKWLGYAWVLVWLNLSSPMIVDGLVRAGMVDAGTLPYSIWRTLGIEKLVS